MTSHKRYRPASLALTLLFLAGFFTLVALRDVSPLAYANEELIAARKAQLEAELKHLEELIQKQQVLLADKQTERATLERDMKIIDAEIEKAKIAVRAQELVIADLEDEIVEKHATILQISERIDLERESLASLLRRSDELDQYTGVEIVLSERTMSEFFEEMDEYVTLRVALHESLRSLQDLRANNEDVKASLETQKENEGELKQLKLLQQNKLKEQEGEKARILRVTKGEETRYQNLIKENERSAAQIRSELFELRGSASINLGNAIEYAVFAGTKTDVRPALILGLLKQETRLGEFLGNGVWTEDMHPTRDRPLFKVITSTLGVDPSSVPVSAKPGYGWGGAMGPAQFIPSTWACFGGYVNTVAGTCAYNGSESFWAGPWEYRAEADRLRVLRGKQSPSNPWDNQDAFMAAALLLRDNGANGGTPQAERYAALRYFAGGNASNPAYAFYGDGVMEHAAYYQKQIDTLKKLSEI